VVHEGKDFKKSGALVQIRIEFVKLPLPLPGKFYERRSQEETDPLRLEFVLLRSHLIERDLFCSSAPCARLRGLATLVWVFSPSDFHRFLATKPVSSETNKAEQWSSGDHGSI